jgi:endonuclease YncB( thermonuclease family)
MSHQSTCAVIDVLERSVNDRQREYRYASMIAEEVEPRPSRARVAMSPPPVEPAGLRIGTVFFLVSVGLIAVATLGASMGIGFYLLVHPPQQAAAEPARGSDAEPGQVAPMSEEGSADADAELRTPNESAAAVQSELTSPTSEASAPIPSAPSSADALLVRPASSSEPERLSSEAGPEPARSEGRGGEDRLSGLQEADHIAPDTTPPPVEGEARDQNRNASPQEQAGEPSNSTEVINGIVTDVPDVATWVVGGRRVRLFGISPGPHKLLAPLVNWVRTKGPVECLPQAGSLSYQCFTATGEDIAEAALLAGIARARERATAAYESAESSAHRMGKGLWAHR